MEIIPKTPFDLIWKLKSLEDRNYFKRSGNKPLMAKIQKLLEELELHPETGIGKTRTTQRKSFRILVKADKQGESNHLYNRSNFRDYLFPSRALRIIFPFLQRAEGATPHTLAGLLRSVRNGGSNLIPSLSPVEN